MDVTYDQGLYWYQRIAEKCSAPSLHPDYVVADAARDLSLEPAFFVYTENEDIYYHAFHLSPVLDTGMYDIQSPYGYGGPVSTTDSPSFLTNAWRAYGDWGKEKGILAEFVRFHPLLQNWRYFNGEIIDDRQTVWLDVQVDDLMAEYTPRTRTAIRKAEKSGLRVEWWESERFYEAFPSLYEDTMIKIGASQFYLFSPEYYQQIIFWEHSELAACLLNNELVAAAIFLLDNHTGEYHLSAASDVGKKMSATNLLLHEGAKRCRQLDCLRLHLGGGTDNDPNNPLLFFKAGFSTNRGFFKIGRYVHQPEQYQKLRDEWLRDHGVVANRVLFYR